MNLPAPSNPQGWDTLLSNDTALADGVAAILHRHGLHAPGVTRYDSGSLPVYAVGDREVLKLFPPHEAEHATVESRTLVFLHGALPVPTPRVLASGTQDGWHYLLMSQLQGHRLVGQWPQLSGGERDRIADDLGRCMAVLHKMDSAPLGALRPDWDEFVPRQRESAVQRQRERGLDACWLEQIDDFLAAWMPAGGVTRSLLHTEIMREHLMVERGADGWRLSGLFDFEPAMQGDPEYDFASVGLFVACGDARLLRRLLLAYGYAPDALAGDALPCRFMAHAILHRYSNLRWYLERLPPEGATTLVQLAHRWWPLSDALPPNGTDALSGL